MELAAATLVLMEVHATKLVEAWIKFVFPIAKPVTLNSSRCKSLRTIKRPLAKKASLIFILPEKNTPGLDGEVEEESGEESFMELGREGDLQRALGAGGFKKALG